MFCCTYTGSYGPVSMMSWGKRLCTLWQGYTLPEIACHVSRSTAGAFLRTSELSSAAEGGGGGGGDACQQRAAGYNRTALGYDCPLFARKFPRETASTLVDLFAR